MQRSDLTNASARRGLRRACYLVLLAVVIGLSISYWSWVEAQARAAVVISSVLDVPVLTSAVDGWKR